MFATSSTHKEKDPVQIGGSTLFGLDIPSVGISAVGVNANPFTGFNHGHYLSSTALGLNKDFAFDPTSATNEPAHRNYLPARQAAVQMSALMWTAFLQSIGGMTAPIHLTCPPDTVVSTDPGQCYATGVALGAPSVSGGCLTPNVTNNAPAQFAKGTNLVRWTATDSCTNNATCVQTVVVIDREPPVISCSTNRVVAATSSSGATVAFSAPASDNCPGVRANCMPPSGFAFPIGTTTVRCAALDASNNRATCSFTVHVKGAAEQVQDLILLVSSFHLGQGPENSLISQLRAALAALSAVHGGDACHPLEAFIHHASAQSGKKLTVSQAGMLIRAATRIQTVLHCAIQPQNDQGNQDGRGNQGPNDN